MVSCRSRRPGLKRGIIRSSESVGKRGMRRLRKVTFFIQATTGICASLYSYCSVCLIIIAITVSAFSVDIVRDINDNERMAKTNSTELRTRL